MAKAVLVIDMPESCDVCDFKKDGICGSYCNVPGIGEYTDDYISCRAEFCPLKPMPEKGDIRKAKTMTTLTWIEGFNACIDAICGKE